MGAFLASIFGGSNPTLNTDINKAGDLSNYGASTGENATSGALNFDQAILSGDPAKIGQILAPQIKGIQDQGQQQKQTLAQFGNRSGGTNAKAQTVDSGTRSAVNDLISKLTGTALTGETNIGENGLNVGLNADQLQAALAQERMQNWKDSILGSALTTGAGALEGYATGGGLGGGTGLNFGAGAGSELENIGNLGGPVATEEPMFSSVIGA